MFDDNKEPNYDPWGNGAPQEPAGGAGQYADDAKYYGGVAAEKASYYAGEAKQKIRKFLPLVIVGIVIIIILFFVLSWLGSQRTINFSISELQGAPLTSTLTITSGGKNYMTPVTATDGTYSITLPAGTYGYIVRKTGYDDATGEITIPTDNTTIAVEMSKKIDVTLELIPTDEDITVYAGQEVTKKILITNNSESQATVTLVPEEKDPIEIQFAKDTTTINANGSDILDFTVKINKDITTETTIKPKILVKGTTKSKELTIDALPSVSAENVIVTPAQLTNDTLTADDLAAMTITIKNNDKKIPLSNVKVTFIPQAGQENKLSWIAFTDYDQNQYTKIIDSIQPLQQATAILNVTPSIEAQEGDELIGTVKIESLSMAAEKTINARFTVKYVKTVQVAVTGDRAISIDCYQTCPSYTTQASDLKLTNLGTVAITTPISLSLVNVAPADDECRYWVEYKTTSVDSLAKAESKELVMRVTPEINGLTENVPKTIVCYLAYTYTDPITNLPQTKQSDPIRITATKKKTT